MTGEKHLASADSESAAEMWDKERVGLVKENFDAETAREFGSVYNNSPATNNDHFKLSKRPSFYVVLPIKTGDFKRTLLHQTPPSCFHNQHTSVPTT